MSFQELARKARSIRRFDQSKPIGKDVLLSLVDIARLSPCGGNQQPIRYRIVDDAETCAAVFPYIAWAAALKDWPGPAEGERPTGYIALLEKNASSAHAGVGIAGQTIQLAATSLGFGACMLGAINRDKLAAVLSLPDPYDIALLIALGVPAETVVIDDVSSGADLSYFRDSADVHHVPKLKLDDVLI